MFPVSIFVFTNKLHSATQGKLNTERKLKLWVLEGPKYAVQRTHRDMPYPVDLPDFAELDARPFALVSKRIR